MDTKPNRTRMRAPERREFILEAAERTFARLGYHVAGMADVAAAAGITQPMLYRHFSSKKELFLEVLDRCTLRILEAWRGAPDLPSMGEAYMRLASARPDVVRLRLLALAECEDFEIRQRVQALYRDQLQLIREVAAREVAKGGFLTGLSSDSVTWAFTALGMLIDVGTALGLGELHHGLGAASELFLRASAEPRNDHVDDQEG